MTKILYFPKNKVIIKIRFFDSCIKLKEANKPSVKKYNNILDTFHLKQHIVKPTRIQKTLIDHIITNIPEKLIYQNVVLADEIGDHDLLYVILNIRKQKFEKHYKYIRDEKCFDLSQYQKDFSQIPMSVVDTFDDPIEQPFMMNELTLSCIK